MKYLLGSLAAAALTMTGCSSTNPSGGGGGGGGGGGTTNRAPTVTINSPASSDTFDVYQSVPLMGTVDDREDGNGCCAASMVWSFQSGSNPNLIQVGTGTSASYGLVPPGNLNTFVLDAADQNGATGRETATANVRISAAGLAYDIDEQSVMTGDGLNQATVAPGANPAWSPDGSRIAFERFDGNDFEVWAADPDGGNAVQLTNNLADDYAPAWSPNGQRLAYVSEVTGNADIYIVDIQTNALVQVTNHPGTDVEPDWAGTLIAFQSDRDGDNEVWVIDDGLMSPAVQLTANGADDRDPHWYAGGTMIVFSSDRAGSQDIFVMAANGSGQTVIISHPAEDREPEVSPDQSKVLFVSSRSGGPDEIWVARIDGSNPLRAVIASGDVGHPRWHP